MPARSTHEGDTVVYRYRAQLAARDVPDAAMHQMFMAHELHNALVAVERAHTERIAEIWAEHPEVAKALDAVKAADEAVLALVDQAKKDRKEDRTKDARSARREELRAARSDLKAARAALRTAQADAYPVVRPAMAVAGTERRAALADAGRNAKAEGLLWHTHDAVLAGHEVADRRIAAAKKNGQFAQHRFHSWKGEGRLRVTLTRNAWKHGCPKQDFCGKGIHECPLRQPNHPPRSPALLASGKGPWRNVAQLPSGMDPTTGRSLRRHGERQTISLRVGSTPGKQPIWWHIPIYVHRPLPENGDVSYIEVIRTRVGGQSRISVCITVRIPPIPQRTAGDVLGVNVGWRSVEGGIRVGVVSSTAPLPPVPQQPELADVIRILAGGRHAEIVVPNGWREVWAHTASVRSVRDLATDAIRRKVVDALKEGVEPEEGVGLPPHHIVERWRSPARFVELTKWWPRDHPLKSDLAAWRVQDKHLWEYEAHERDQIIARRQDAWRKVAAWLLDSDVALMVVPEVPVAALTQVPLVEDGDSRQAQLARAQRQLAAPSSLTSALRTAAARRGVRAVAPDAAGASRTHLSCGHEVTDPDATRDSVMVWCPKCQIAYDQDVNAADTVVARTLSDLAHPPTPSA